MTKNTSDALRRADRTLVTAFVLVVSFSAGIFLGHNAPSTEQVASGTKQAAHKVAAMARDTAQAASGAARFVERTGYEAGRAVAAMPAVATTAAVTLPLRGTITAPSAAELEMVKILQDQRCLAEAMYYEARGEGREGQEAIAEVVFHRMHTSGYPRSICGVVYQGAAHKHGCQFSFACDGELEQSKSPGAWSQARILAAKIMAGLVRLGDITSDAISFHAADVQPDWADRLERTIQIGNHVFYRAPPRTKSS
jgi:hypothetical protein